MCKEMLGTVLKKILANKLRTIMYALLVSFLCYFGNLLYGLLIFPVEKHSLAISFYVKQYIQEYGQMPLSQSDLIDKSFQEINDIDNKDTGKERQLVQFKDSIKNINIAYGVKLQDITEKQGVLYSKSTGDKIMLIEGPHSYWFGLKGLYEKISYEWFELICDKESQKNLQ